MGTITLIEHLIAPSPKAGNVVFDAYLLKSNSVWDFGSTILWHNEKKINKNTNPGHFKHIFLYLDDVVIMFGGDYLQRWSLKMVQH